MKLTVGNGFRERKIYFTRYELLKILRWTTEGRSYTRLQNAFDRLSGVRIKATNAFYDNDSKAHSTRNFGIVDAYEINHGGETNSKPSFFIWSEVLFKSFQVGFIKKLDLDFYLNLKSAISKRLYRYLDKHFWYKSRLEINLFVLAHEKIGISRNYKFASSIRQQLDPAVRELVSAGFISRCEYAGRGSETQVVFYAASKTPRALSRKAEQGSAQAVSSISSVISNSLATVSSEDIDHGSLYGKIVARLEERGLKAKQARSLLERRSEGELERIAQIVDYFDTLVASGSHLVNKSPVGFLYRAVENASDFVLPSERSEKPLQTQLSFSGGESKSTKSAARQAILQSEYLIAKKREAQRLMEQVEDKLLQNIRREIEQGISKLRGKISDAGFEQTVAHGIEEKLLKLFAFPEFEEWARGRR